ncbi:hypothetical protein SF285071_2654 [Shigella flexneri 2850-71]|nr:hypothetical protein SF285071_2654 [Shigella flexneri 2850-71]
MTQRLQHAFARKKIGCFTYNPWAIMKVSYNRVFLPEGLPIVCYNRAIIFKMDSIFVWVPKLKLQKRRAYAVN